MSGGTRMEKGAETGSSGELEARLALLAPGDCLYGFLFNGALRVVRDLGDEALWARCLEVCGGERFRSFFSYPASTLLRLLDLESRALSELQGGPEEAMRYLGRQVVPEYLNSASGAMLMVLAGREPKRLFISLPSVYRTSMPLGSCSLKWTGPRSGVLFIKGCVVPMPYLEGAMAGAFEAAKMTGVRVRGHQESLLESAYEVAWG